MQKIQWEKEYWSGAPNTKFLSIPNIEPTQLEYNSRKIEITIWLKITDIGNKKIILLIKVQRINGYIN